MTSEIFILTEVFANIMLLHYMVYIAVLEEVRCINCAQGGVHKFVSEMGRTKYVFTEIQQTISSL